MGFPGGAVVKNPLIDTGDARDSGQIPGSARSRGAGNGNPHQYSCLENSMDRGPGSLVHGVTESDMTGRAGMHCNNYYMREKRVKSKK